MSCTTAHSIADLNDQFRCTFTVSVRREAYDCRRSRAPSSRASPLTSWSVPIIAKRSPRSIGSRGLAFESAGHRHRKPTTTAPLLDSTRINDVFGWCYSNTSFVDGTQTNLGFWTVNISSPN